MFTVRQFERTNFSVSFLVNNEFVVSNIKGSNIEFGHDGTVGGGVASVDENVVANFPAKVVKVNVQKGDHIKQNDTIIVLEAMKMESQIKTPKDCTVSDILVKEGVIVERGTMLAKLKFD